MGTSKNLIWFLARSFFQLLRCQNTQVGRKLKLTAHLCSRFINDKLRFWRLGSEKNLFAKIPKQVFRGALHI